MAVRIAVVADTHLPRFGRSLPEPLKTGFADAGIDRAIHCGDWVEPFVVDLFEAVAPVDGVAGNNDPPELIERFGLTSVLDVDGVRIGITHGHVGPTRLTTLERARLAFATEPEMAAICFGHSHIPSITRLPGGPLLVNPGSPTDKRRQRHYSWALLTVERRRVDAELRFFDRYA
ncbi:MAG TPA: metallophosphoesterase family protein [Candidatus Limnocylindrales bacterium]|nr:metallophosphoesterase family protein [Candidatus Limnocylindrales bacterium]